MKKIIGPRRSGKTTELIKEAAETRKYILVTSRSQAERMFHQAREMELDINFPVTVEEFKKTHFVGTTIQRNGLLVDDALIVLQDLLHIQVHAAVVSNDE